MTMGRFFCSDTKRRRLERKRAIITATLSTLQDFPKRSTSPRPGDLVSTFRTHYTGDSADVDKYERQLGRALQNLAEHRRRDEIVRKLEKKNARIGEKLGMADGNATREAKSADAESVGRSSGTTLVDSDEDDDEKEGNKEKERKDSGADLEMVWTWSALGEAF